MKEQVPVQEVLKRVKSGQSLGRLAEEYDVSWLTLKRRLLELIGKGRYKAVRKRIKRIRVKPRSQRPVNSRACQPIRYGRRIS